MRHRQRRRFSSVLGTLVLSTFFAATLIGCEEANHDLADPPDPIVDQSVIVDPVVTDRDAVDRVRVDGTDERTDVNIDIDRQDGIDRPDGAETREERREERRARIRETLDDVNVDVDGERTDVQIGDGKIDIEAQ